MIHYSQKQKWKLLLFIAAILIGSGSMYYTNKLVRSLSDEEREKVELWAEAIRELQEADVNENISKLVYRIIKNNKTIPLIQVDQDGNILETSNLDSAKLAGSHRDRYLKNELEIMKDQHEPIQINLLDNKYQYIYYKDSILLKKLFYYPLVQLTVICLFIFVSYLAFSTSKRSEQNQVWVGMSKETAHQLGTPISSLMAWVEILKSSDQEEELVKEVEKDVKRLDVITDRFSKIGSAPVLTKHQISGLIYKAVSYLKTRTSNRITYSINFPEDMDIFVPVNESLFEWVIENLCKNAIDAMNGEGHIDIDIKDNVQVVYIDIADTGKGISKSKYKTIFQPGFTTKKRGWGLGLSLSKRIIEINHGGKIFVKNSEVNRGTTFRIVLKKQAG